LAAPFRLAAVWRARPADRLLIAPQDVRTADPTIAEDIYGGYFVFHGKAVNTHGESPFLVEAPSIDWSQALAGFGWLRHLRAADTMLARVNARALLSDWMELRGAPPAGDPAGRQAAQAGWDVETTSRRLLSWISQSPLILDGADRAFYRRFMKSLARQAVWLARALEGGLRGPARLGASVALAQYALCADVSSGQKRRAFKILEAELRRQILPDGGHVSRNMRLVVETLLDILPLRQAFAARGVAPPQSLLNAVDRMLPMLRQMRHDDGALALFNGMGATRPDFLAALLAYDDSAPRAGGYAPHSGYLRLESGAVRLIADVGAPPPRPFSGEAHAGALSFELTVDGERLIVNCGASERWRAEWRESARQTAAHSTLTVDDTSSVRFAPTKALSSWLDGQLVQGLRVDVERDPDGRAASARHDGYARRFRLAHRRAWRVWDDGVEGVDLLESIARKPAAHAPPFALRFHLHPGVRIEPGAGGALRLTTPSGAAWAFRCDAPTSVEESVFFAAPEGPKPTSQIVVSVETGAFAPVQWSFARL
jgi:uncharacterized heparinase superfamily protein